LGLRLLGAGISSPFLNLGPAYSYKTLDDAVRAAASSVDDFHDNGGAPAFLPKSFGPLCFVFTGAGKVSTGAQKIFRAWLCVFVGRFVIEFVNDRARYRIFRGTFLVPRSRFSKKT
jgi:hypothetical protein